MTSERNRSDSPLGDDADNLLGRTIADRYRVEHKIGEGGMGAVWLVEHTHMRKRLALKVLHRDFSTHTEIVARFEREAMAAANIDHPNVVQATDFGKLPDGSFYLALEYVEGTDLRKALCDGLFACDRAVHIVLQVLYGLKRAHELRIVHRDLKPENILLVERDGDPDFVKILDFGIARVPLGSVARGHASDAPLTRAGTVYGTPEYMSPEQALGQTIDGRADLYSVGVLLFEMLSGRRPYEDKDKVALLGQHVAAPIPSLRARAPHNVFISPDLEAIVTKLLAKDPVERYPDAESVARALFALGFDARPSSSRPPDLVGDDPSATFAALREQSSRRIKVRASDSLLPRIEATPIKTLPRAAGWPGTPAAEVSSIDAAHPVVASVEEPIPDSKSVPVSTPLDGKVTVVAPPTRRLAGTLVHPRIVAALLAGLAVGTLVVALSLRQHERSRSQGTKSPPSTSVALPTDAPQQPLGSTTTVTAPAAPIEDATARLRNRCLTALGKVASGETETGLSELAQVAAEHPDDASVLRALTQGYSKARRHAQALSTLRKLLTIAPESKSDPLLDPVLDDAVAVAQLYDELVAILTGPMSPEGGRVLYAWALTSRGPGVVRPRAVRSMLDPTIQKRLSPAVRAAFELERATTCRERRSVLEKHRNDFDDLALSNLRQIAKTTGCGVAKKQDCWPCLRDDNLAEKILADLEAHPSKP